MRYISGHYVFTGSEFIKHGVIETDPFGRITDVGALGDSIIERSGTEFFNGIILPGFINAHCHIELSHMRGIVPERAGMTAFCNSIMSYGNTDIRRQISAMTEADIAMEKEGIVAVGDISNSGLSAPVKKNSRLIYRTFIETLGLNPAKADEIFAKARNLKQDFERCGLQASITPHAPYSLSEELFKLSVDEGNRSGTVSIHNKESADESELFETKRGAMRTLFGKDLDGFLPEYENPSHRILKYIASDARLLLVHNTYANGQDVEQANRCNKKTTWVICPGSNLYIENRLPDIDLLLKHGAHIAVGTDSLSSNTCLSILNELKILNRFFPETSLQNLLRWATLNGAQALGFDSVLGSFDKGKRPGALLLSGIDFHNMRLTDKSKVRRLI